MAKNEKTVKLELNEREVFNIETTLINYHQFLMSRTDASAKVKARDVMALIRKIRVQQGY